jgi:hypothetical protein
MRSEGTLRDEHQRAADIIRRGIHGAESIDDLLHFWRDEKATLDVGKLAIAQAIAESEQGTTMATAGRDQFLNSVSQLKQSWLGQAVTRLIKPDIPRRRIQEVLAGISFIIFNYDRCVERFLVGEIQSLGYLSEQEANSILDGIPIVHPHGSLGPIHGPDTFLRYGSTEDVWLFAKKIRTYTEEEKDQDSLVRMEDLLRGAGRVVMLGFGYHPANIQLLFKCGLGDVPDIVGTCFQPNDARARLFQEQLQSQGAVRRAARLQTMHCDEFVQNLSTSLFQF